MNIAHRHRGTVFGEHYFDVYQNPARSIVAANILARTTPRPYTLAYDTIVRVFTAYYNTVNGHAIDYPHPATAVHAKADADDLIRAIITPPTTYTESGVVVPRYFEEWTFNYFEYFIACVQDVPAELKDCKDQIKWEFEATVQINQRLKLAYRPGTPDITE